MRPYQDLESLGLWADPICLRELAMQRWHHTFTPTDFKLGLLVFRVRVTSDNTKLPTQRYRYRVVDTGLCDRQAAEVSGLASLNLLRLRDGGAATPVIGGSNTMLIRGHRSTGRNQNVH